MIAVTPDKQGFAEAQEQLRQKLGMDITFYTPDTAVWDLSLSDEQFDPETGLPYDPMIDPVASGFASTVIRCSVVNRPFMRLGAGPGETQAAMGIMSDQDIGLIMASGYASAASAATEFDYAGKRYQVHSTLFDGIGDIQRFVVHGRRDA